VRKLFSILVTVGLVLGMIASSVPASAQFGPGGVDWTKVEVVVFDSDCEGELGTYNITLRDLPASLTQGVHTITVKFPVGTGYPATWSNRHIRIWDGTAWSAVFAGEITRAGDEVTFLVPVTYLAGLNLTVQFKEDTVPTVPTGVVNPPAGRYNLHVKTSRAPMSTYVMSEWVGTPLPTTYKKYIIRPTFSTFKYTLDFSPTYPGIATDFIPPFQACGQNDTPPAYLPPNAQWFDTTFVGGKWVTNFTLKLSYDDLIGCNDCPEMRKRIELRSAPAGGVATFGGNFTRALDRTSVATGTHIFPWDAAYGPLAANFTETYNLTLHFNVPGDYEICFMVQGRDPVCDVGCGSFERCEVFTVHQWKDAYPIPLYRKWNFISFPLHLFDTDIENVLSAFDWTLGTAVNNFGAVWYYDGCAKTWAAHPNLGLTTMDAGKGYWLRTRYTTTLPAGQHIGQLWVFGHAAYRPGTPMGVPAEYPVCSEWNAIGFTSLTTAVQWDYLWNFRNIIGIPEYGPAIGWNAPTQFPLTVQYPDVPGLLPTHGYWVSFAMAGKIFP